MIRPQMKRAKEHKAMIEALQKGDEVVTAGGVLGRITKVVEGTSPRDRAEQRESRCSAPVQTLLPKGTKGTIKSLVTHGESVIPIWNTR